MGIKDLLRLVDDKLEEAFNAKPYDPAKDRQRFIRGLDRTTSQFKATGVVRGRKWFSRKNGVVKFSPGVSIGGKSTLFVPEERFPEFITTLKKTVEAGDLDKEIATTGQSNRGGPNRRRGGWSPERRAAYEAKKKSGK